jgi:hypothetical protein
MTGSDAAKRIRMRGIELPLIAGISLASVSAVRAWIGGAEPPEAASLRLIIALRLLNAIGIPGRISPLNAPRISTFAELVARHCRSS